MEIKDILNDLPVLETERLILRKFEDKDVNDLFEYCSDEQTVKYVTFPLYTDIQMAKDRINDLKEKYKKGEIACWAIEDKQTGKMIGSIDFVNIYEKDKKVEIGYILNKNYWNKGYITEANKKIIEFGLNEMNLVRMQARCISENIGSAKVMEKSGMEFEGLFRKAEYRNNTYYDVKYYAIIK